jgi:hypothetical protein
MKKIMVCFALIATVAITSEVMADPVGDCMKRNKGIDTPAALKEKCTANPQY